MPSYPGRLSRLDHEVIARDLKAALDSLKKIENRVRKAYPQSTLVSRRAAHARDRTFDLLSGLDGQFHGERHEGFQDVYISGPPDSRYLINGQPSSKPAE